jgi:hypothetical protein
LQNGVVETKKTYICTIVLELRMSHVSTLEETTGVGCDDGKKRTFETLGTLRIKISALSF